MKIIFCNITYLRYYDGRIEGELTPKSGGRWVMLNSDAHEKWNFLNMDGKCYGYMQGLSDCMHIERVEKTNSDSVEDVTVVWAAFNGEKTVIVGWYEHATLYRYLQSTMTTPISGIDRDYWCETKAENAYLMPEEMRTFEIGRASKKGSGKGFGQYNYWFADSEYAKENIIPEVVEYISNHRKYRINTLNDEFTASNDNSPLTDDELEYLKALRDDQYKEYLKYGYKLYYSEKSADSAYFIAEALMKCFQYRLAIKWLEKTIELDPEDRTTTETLIYIYQQCEMFDKSNNLAKEYLNTFSDVEPFIRDEIYCVISDNYYFQGNIKKAVEWLNTLIETTQNDDLKDYAKDRAYYLNNNSVSN